VADVLYRRPKSGDLESILANIRQADREECEALFGAGSLPEVAKRTMASAMDVWVAEVNRVPVAMLGVSGEWTGSGRPWMFGTDEVERQARSLMRDSRQYIQHMLGAFQRLENVVDARNTKYIRWLKRVGFRILSPINIGVAGLPFHPFRLEN